MQFKTYLFQNFPKLQEKIPYIKLCDLPTPVYRLERLADKLNYKNIFIKRDDLSGKKVNDQFRLYGGNKVRKLEFLLSDAQKHNAKTIITYGGVGSNHALATATYANQLNLKSILMLTDQPTSDIVRHNLLLDRYYNADLRFFANDQERSLASENILKSDNSAYLIPLGGSNPIGTLGFVNAAFELAEQIKLGEIPEPDFIYLAIGSCATAAGLLLGLKAVGLKSKVVAVTVEPEIIDGEIENRTKDLFNQTNKLLSSLDPSFKIYDFNFIVNKNVCGIEYGLATQEANQAITILKDTENIALEGTYSSRPMAAIIDDISNNNVKNENILFWNTYCGIDYSDLLNFNDYKNLPAEFHKYFE